jgi:hypothetical protein
MWVVLRSGWAACSGCYDRVEMAWGLFVLVMVMWAVLSCQVVSVGAVLAVAGVGVCTQSPTRCPKPGW